MNSLLIISAALLAPAGVDGATIEQTLATAAGTTIEQKITCTCNSEPCPSRPPCPVYLCPPFVAGDPLDRTLLLRAHSVQPEPPWYNLHTYARLVNYFVQEEWDAYLASYYRTRYYTLQGDHRHGYLGDVITGPFQGGLYSYCLNADAPYLAESCTVDRMVLLRLRIHHPSPHPFDRDGDDKIGKLDAQHFILCWHGLDETGDLCEGTVGIPPQDN